MSDKLLSEFTSKLNRTRNVLQDINRQCSFMKKDLKKLEGELAVATAEKDKALQTEENLKIHFISTKVLYDEEHEKQVNEHERLVKLRRLKKQKLREKDLMKKELDRANQELNQLLRERGELEHTAQNLSEKLDKASMERLNAETECREHGKVLDNLDAELDELRNERNSLNQVVTATIEEEVKAASSKQF